MTHSPAQQTAGQPPAVEARDLERSFGSARALDGLSLSIQQGESVAVLGPSGCGKSTFLKLVAGLDEPTGGEIRINGTLVSAPGRAAAPERRPVNMVFQDYALWPHMSVEKIITYGMRHRGVGTRNSRKKRVEELLELLQLEGMAKRYPRELSGGQQQRVAIARALATEPAILLFDEPLSNLDSQLRRRMRHELADLLTQLGSTAMYVTHDLQEALTIGDRLAVLRAGQLEQFDTAEEVYAAPATPWVAGLVGFSNVFYGTVLNAPGLDTEAGSTVTINAAGELFHACSPVLKDTPESAKVCVVTHPSSLQVTGVDGPAVAENSLDAEVLSTHYEGNRWHLRLKVLGHAVEAYAPGRYEPGQKVQVQFNTTDARAFPDQQTRAELAHADLEVAAL